MRRIGGISLVLLVLLVLLSACSDPSVRLSYRLEEGRTLRYRLRLVADIERSLQGETREERVEATFRADQEILQDIGDGRTQAQMTLDPISLTVDGSPEPTGPTQEFLVTLGPDGEVETVEEVTEGGAEPLAPVGIERLLPRLRPVLPGTPVSPGATWTGSTRVQDADGTFSVESRSHLAALGRRRRGPAALVRTTYTSPVDRREVFANAVADLSGRDVGTQEAWFSLQGFLLRSEGDSVGRFDVGFRPPGGDVGIPPVRGRLHVRLHSEMALV